MAYRVELEDAVVVEVVRFDPALKLAWDRCIATISYDPWPRSGIGFGIIELERWNDHAFAARWFPAAIRYLSRQYSADDGFLDGFEGEVRVYALVW